MTTTTSASASSRRASASRSAVRTAIPCAPIPITTRRRQTCSQSSRRDRLRLPRRPHARRPPRRSKNCRGPRATSSKYRKRCNCAGPETDTETANSRTRLSLARERGSVAASGGDRQSRQHGSFRVGQFNSSFSSAASRRARAAQYHSSSGFHTVNFLGKEVQKSRILSMTCAPSLEVYTAPTAFARGPD